MPPKHATPNSFIDAHCHLAYPRFSTRIDEVIRLSRSQGLVAFIQGGVDPGDWDRQLELQKKYSGIVFPCFGLHPWYVAGRMGVVDRAQLMQDLERLPQYLPQASGIGELGLDLGKKTDPTTEALQLEIFEEQLKLARKFRKPLVLHIVNAHTQALKLLENYGPWPAGGIVHAFSGKYELAQNYIKLGLTLSVGAAAVNAGKENFKRALKKIPMDQIVVESDSPDQIPESFGALEEGLNDPRSLFVVAQAICDLKGLGPDSGQALLQGSRERLKKIFKLELQARKT